jgi:DNA repair photolyase
MRWDNLSSTRYGDPGDPPEAASAAPPLPLALSGAVTRTFDTPGFAGMTFYEVRARSIINRVPGASRVPFEWTVNPYRGCSHACVYCLAGETEILLADGRTRPLAELRVGDEIYGTVAQGNHRRYVRTTVLAHWSTVKPAYRITLEDGTTLTASADHRFLTPRGWKHVTAAPPGEPPRPYLTITDSLLGIGRSGSVTGEPERDGTGQATPAPLDGTILSSRTALRVRRIEPLGRELRLYDITTGTGDFIANGVVSHNCFARNTHTYLDLDPGRDFDTRVIVKVNAGELLRRELAAPRWRGGHIAMGTNVDCYQRAEGRYRLMPQILAALRDFANPFSILTKGTLIVRDLPLLRQAAEVTQVSLSLSVGFVDERLWRAVEPGAPSPRRRLDVVRRLRDAGFAVGVLMAPILPGLTDTDDSIEETVAAIAAAGAVSVTPLPLHLRPGARQWYAAWLAREFPGLVPRYRKLYGAGSYLPQAYQREVTARVRIAARRYGLHRPAPGETRQVPPDAAPTPAVEQLSLL